MQRLTGLLQVCQETHPFNDDGSQLLGRFLVDCKNRHCRPTRIHLRGGSHLSSDGGPLTPRNQEWVVTTLLPPLLEAQPLPFSVASTSRTIEKRLP